MLFKRNYSHGSEEEKHSFCFSMEQIFNHALNKNSSYVVEGSQEELLQKSSKLILFYSDLITLLTRNRNGGVLIITLTYHANNIIRKLTSVYIADAQDKDVFLKVEIKNALNSLETLVEIMKVIENNGWLWFKDEKMIIKDFLTFFKNPLNKGFESE